MNVHMLITPKVSGIYEDFWGSLASSLFPSQVRNSVWGNKAESERKSHWYPPLSSICMHGYTYHTYTHHTYITRIPWSWSYSWLPDTWYGNWTQSSSREVHACSYWAVAPAPLYIFQKLNLFFMVFYLYVCVYHMDVWCPWGPEEGLELQMVVNHSVGSGAETGVSGRAISPAPPCFVKGVFCVCACVFFLRAHCLSQGQKNDFV